MPCRKSGFFLALAVLSTILATGCSILPFGSPDMAYPDAKNKLQKLVDEGLRAGLNGGEPLVDARDLGEICTDSNLAPTGEIYPTLTYHFPLEQLGPHLEGFIERVAGYWELEGMNLDVDDDMQGIHAVFATSSDGFALETFVNDRTGMALVTGSGPCVEGEPAGFEEEIE